MTRKIILLRILLLCFGVVFVYSAWNLISLYVEAKKEAKAFNELAAFVEAAAPKSEELVLLKERIEAAKKAPEPINPAVLEAMLAEAKERENAARLVQYAALSEQNKDFFGWILIEGTKINYPVMYTPYDPEHYIHRAFNGSYASGGVPFLDANCTKEGNLFLIYGHHMKNGTMFAALSDYEKQSFWREHPIVRFDTVGNITEYEVMSAFYTEIIWPDDGRFQYWQYTDLSDPDVFNTYVTNIKRLSLYDTGITAEYGDTIVTLSTCSYHTDNGRFVVVARKKAGE